MRTQQLLPTALGLALCSGLIACTASQDVRKVEAQAAAPINCATAEGDIRMLNNEKASVADQIARGVTAIVPVGAVVGIVSGQEGSKFEIASGEYNTMIDKRIAAIRARCNLPE
jgi:hypothetical protein